MCEEASCPNIGEGGDKGTATFMIIGDRWTRRCPFCYVGHGRPDPLDINEPANLAKTIVDLKLSYAVITSVDRDAPRDDGAGHFVDCVHKTRELLPRNKIEVQVPNFRGRLEKALKFFADGRPDVLNDKLGPVPRLHEEARPGADYKHSLGSPSN